MISYALSYRNSLLLLLRYMLPLDFELQLLDDDLPGKHARVSRRSVFLRARSAAYLGERLCRR